MNPQDIKSILVLQTAFLGDLLLCIPLLKNLRKYYPEARIELVCRSPFAHFFMELGLVDKAWDVNKKDPKSIQNLKKELAAKSVDLLFTPHESFRTFLFATKVKAKVKLGFKRWFNFIFQHRIKRDMRFPDAIRQMSLLAEIHPEFKELHSEFCDNYLKHIPEKLSDLSDRVKVPKWASMKVETQVSVEWIHQFGIYQGAVALAPGSVWNTKRWRKEHYIELGKILAAQGEKIILLGSPAEAELCEEIANQIEGAVNLAGKTKIMDLYYILSECSYLVCNDSGTMHMATVAGLPLVSVFGPTVLSIGYRPWQDKAIVAQVDLKCRPCGLHGHDKCPIGTHDCMKNVTVDAVLKDISTLRSNIKY